MAALSAVNSTMRKVGRMVPVIGSQMPLLVGWVLVGGGLYYFLM